MGNQIQLTRNISPAHQVLTARVMNRSIGKQVPPTTKVISNFNKSRITMNNSEWVKENSITGERFLNRNVSGPMFTTF